MITILADHDIEGQARALWRVVLAEGWQELTPLKYVEFADVGLSPINSDRVVWRFAQANNMLLLTNNRNMADADSLEATIREENHPASLPVMTIASVDRMAEHGYCQRCAGRLAEIVSEIDKYKVIGRLFIP
jgi:hypothetical protein